MSDYTNTYGGAAKDAANDIILGADVDTQLDNIATMSATKADKGDAWPVGSIFLSVVATTPASLLGYGTWVQIAKGRTLIGEGTGAGLTARTAGAEVGQEDAVNVSHSHGVTDPTHSHPIWAGNATGLGGSVARSGSVPGNYGASTGNSVNSFSGMATGVTVDSAGVSGTDKNMQPSLVVYIWNRTA